MILSNEIARILEGWMFREVKKVDIIRSEG